jgi:hypothetical protein
LIVKHICNEDIRKEAQFSAAVEYLLSRAASGIVEAEFLEASGVGIVISQDEIEDAVSIREIKQLVLAGQSQDSSVQEGTRGTEILV